MPKFVGAWLRETNVTGRLRSNRAPNKLIQDIEWRYMLCAACEGRLSVFEDEVCRSIFLPIHERKEDRFRYGPSFARFAVSVAWRTLVVLQREGGLGHLSEIPRDVETVEVAWREFLLERRSTPAPHVVHALPMDVPSNLDSKGVSPHYSRFVLRTPAIGTHCRDGAGYVIVKMARLIIFGTVASAKERRDWRATQLHVGGGSWGVEKYHVPGWVRHYLESGAQQQEKFIQEVSTRQKQRTNETIMKAIEGDAELVASSDVFRAFEADLKLFGDSSFQRPSDEEPQE